MDTTTILLMGVLLISLLTIVGGLIVLLKQKIVVTEKGAVSSVELPWFGKLSTNYPSLIAVLLGVGLAFHVTTKLDPGFTAKRVPLVVELSTEKLPADGYVFVSAVPQRYLSATNALVEGKASLKLEVDEPGPYSVIAFTVTREENGRNVYAVNHGPAQRSPETNQLTFASQLIGIDKTEFDDAN